MTKLDNPNIPRKDQGLTSLAFSCANTLCNISAVPMVRFPKAFPTVSKIMEMTRAPSPTALGTKVSPPSAEPSFSTVVATSLNSPLYNTWSL